LQSASICNVDGFITTINWKLNSTRLTWLLVNVKNAASRTKQKLPHRFRPGKDNDNLDSIPVCMIFAVFVVVVVCCELSLPRKVGEVLVGVFEN
jgi:hypothetical protein